MIKKLRKKEWIAVTVALVVVFVTIIVPSFEIPLIDVLFPEQTEGETIVLENGLGIRDVVFGDGGVASSGAIVSVHYSGSLEDGTIFDSSYTRGAPFVFQLGSGQVIDGWDIGVQGMRVGGVRRLVIPPHLGYGDAGIGPIPGGATLFFEIELISVENQ